MSAAADGRAPGTTLIVLAKAPVPGRVKTRLTPPYTPQEAARIAEASLADTLDAALATPVRRRVLFLDGEPGPWLPPGIEVLPQCAGGLDERIAAAFAACSGPALLIGMDTPQVTPALLAPALADPRPGEAWFGSAEDGGFWALGLTDPDPALLLGVPMSVAETGRVQRQRLSDAGLVVRELAWLRDVDTAGDARLVARLAPHGRFARALDAGRPDCPVLPTASLPAAIGSSAARTARPSPFPPAPDEQPASVRAASDRQPVAGEPAPDGQPLSPAPTAGHQALTAVSAEGEPPTPGSAEGEPPTPGSAEGEPLTPGSHAW